MTHGGFRSLRSLHPCLPGRAGTTYSAGASSPSLRSGPYHRQGSLGRPRAAFSFSCWRPLRGALVRCGGDPERCSALARLRPVPGRLLARSEPLMPLRPVGLVRAPGALCCDGGTAMSRRPLGCCGCGGLAAASSPPARPLRRAWQPRGRPVSARSPARSVGLGTLL